MNCGCFLTYSLICIAFLDGLTQGYREIDFYNFGIFENLVANENIFRIELGIKKQLTNIRKRLIGVRQKITTDIYQHPKTSDGSRWNSRSLLEHISNLKKHIVDNQLTNINLFHDR